MCSTPTDYCHSQRSEEPLLILIVKFSTEGLTTVFAWQFHDFLKITYGTDAVVPLFWSRASFLAALFISLIKIERIVRGVAGRVIALYRPSPPEDIATGQV
jgi:hypothetical protein